MKRIVQDTKLDYSGQILYVGIDVHLKSWKISVMTNDVKFKAFSQEPDAEILYQHLTKRYPNGEYKCVYEAGFSGFWLQEALSAKGVSCKVVHPGDVPTMDKERQFKSDTMDCRKLARCLKDGTLDYIYIPPKQLQQDRALVRTRYKIKRDLGRVQNRIVSYLHFMGIKEGTEKRYWGKSYINWLTDLVSGQGPGHGALKLLLGEYQNLRLMEREALRQLRLLAKEERFSGDVELLKSVPGVALLTALRLLVEIGDIRRFKNLDKLCSMVGLIPTTSSSGENDRVGQLTKRGRSELRTALIESAWVAITVDPELALCYQKYKKRMTGHKAIVKVAKKLLNRIRGVLLKKEKYIIASLA